MSDPKTDASERGSVLLTELGAEQQRDLTWALRAAGFKVTLAAESKEAWQLISEQPFDLMLCAVEPSARLSVALLRQLVEKGVPLSVAFLTVSPDINLAIDVMRLGAVDLLLQPMALAELIERVAEGVRKGKRLQLLQQARERVAELLETAEALDAAFVSHPASGRRLRAAAVHDDPLNNLDAPLLARLSPRERDVTRRLAQGASISQMATQLSLSPNTVRNHVKSIFGKLQVRSQVALLSKLVGGRLVEGKARS